jgi:pimeloyl-ACP methyl ester carboxylesterase
LRKLFLLLAVLMVAACGGGGGGGSSNSTPAPTPAPTDPEPEATVLELIDAIPSAGATSVDPSHSTSSFAHLGHSDLTISYSSDCTEVTATTLRRSLQDMATVDFDQILDHRLRCNLTENTSYTMEVEGTRANDAAFAASHAFSTTVASPSGLAIIDQSTLPRSQVGNMFTGYVEGALLTELDLPSFLETLVIDLIIELSEANWDNLVDPDALYDVVSQRVSYLSRNPNGEVADTLTGLITLPVPNGEFVMRDKMIVLTHATGSTPGDASPADAWYILANLFASRGYLVIAPDNYGRGGTQDEPETYLMANRTAMNAMDLLDLVLAHTSYDEIYPGSDITVIGYSQGGHSAIGLWQMLSTQGPANINIREVYAGGAPHNLYQTFRGVLRHIDDSCNDGAYCRFVDTETTVPFATDRILPGFMNYTDTGTLSLDDIVIGDDISAEFVTGFLANEPAYDKLKAQLQLSSFTNIASAPESFGGSETLLHLYHSEFDRLVPIENTEELAAVLSDHVSVNFHQNRCNSSGYETIFNLTEKVGVLHTLCGLSVLDDAMEDLK